MNYVLLLGAGFSRNWGGWLASELIGDLLTRVGDDAHLNQLLRRANGFEQVLEQLQTTLYPEEDQRRYARYVEAIKLSFAEMNRQYLNVGFEFSNYVDNSIRKFLGQFDAIFTLNQDLLLELHYNSIELLHPNKWSGFNYPGMSPPRNWHSMLPQEKLEPTAVWSPLPPEQFSIGNRCQPIFKLHGSVNWQTSSSNDLLVVGSDKQIKIKSEPILDWYSKQFLNFLGKPQTKLMVIGYSFLDQHINQIILDSWVKNNFGMFLIEPRGLDVLRTQHSNDLHTRIPLESITSIGYSTRPLSTTFKNDPIEFSKINRFFEQ